MQKNPPAAQAGASTPDAQSTSGAPVGPNKRRAALISSFVAVPVAVLVAFALTSGSRSNGTTAPTGSAGGVLAPLTIAPLPANPSADAGCLKVIERLPVNLASLAPRRVFSSSTYIVAWGDPPVVLKCGVARPATLSPGSSEQVIDTGTGAGLTAQWFPVKVGKSTIWTTIDRAVYVEVTIPASRQPADVLPPLSAAIAKALPAVCQAFPQPAPTVFDQKLKDSLCVFRK